MISFRKNFSSLFALSVLSIAGGCGGGGEATGPSVATTVTANSSTTLTAAAGAAVTELPSVRVRDQRGAAMAGVAVTFGVTGGGGNATQSSATTNASGVATVGGWTLGTVAGANTLVASSGSLSPVTFSANGVAGSPTTITGTAGDAQTAVAGSAVPVAPSVTVKDANANPVSGVSVVFSVSSGGGSVSGATQTTNVAGVATVGGWTLGMLGPNTLVATIGASTPVTFSASAVLGAPAIVTKSAGDAQTAVAGSPVGVAPSVTVTDANGNPLPGVSVVFAAASGGGSISGGTQTTNAAGVATVGGWTLGTSAGANSLSATAAALSPVAFSATGTAGAAATITKSAGDVQSATVGSAVAVPPSVTVTDANGNAVAGVSVVFAIVSGGGSVSGATQTTNAAGVATVGGWTLGTTAGANTLRASSGALAPVTFGANGTVGAAAAITKSAGDAQAATVGTAVAVDPSVTVRDANGNPVSGVSVVFSVSSGGGSVSNGTQTTNVAGVATVGGWTLGTTAGANTLSATAGSLTPVAFSATGTAGAATTITKSGGDAQSAIAGSAVATDPSVTATDAHGNPVSGVSVVFAVTSGGGSVSGGTQTTNAAGVATVGSWTLGTTAGPNTISATAGSLTALSFSATGTAGAAATVTKTGGDGQTADAATLVAIAPSVLVQDANGNNVAGATVTFSVGIGGGSVTAGTQITSAVGTAAVGSWRLGQAGTNTLVARVGSLTPVTFNATANPPPDPCAFSVAYTIGSTVNGELDAGDCLLPDGSFVELYSTSLTVGAYRFTETAAFDTHLYLFASPGGMIAEWGNLGQQTSTFKALVPTASYGLRTGSFGPGVSGSYTFSSTPASSAINNCETVFVLPGVTLAQTLSTTDCFSSSFYSDDVHVRLNAGQVVTITMSSTVFDAYLEIFSGASLAASNDNKDGTTSDAEIVFTAPAAGTYRIVPRTALTNTTGDYSLKVTSP